MKPSTMPRARRHRAAAIVPQAEAAEVAKSRFLAAASHDLRQPLQTLALIHGLLAQTVEGERSRRLLARFEAALGAMSGALTTLLEISQPGDEVSHPEMAWFPVGPVLDRLAGEFAYHAEARGVALHVLASRLQIRSDPRLLGRLIRILLADVVRRTSHGKILLGCRRRGRRLRIEIWSADGGGAEEDARAPHPSSDRPARDPGRELGLSIARRLARALGHRLSRRARADKGPVFAIEVELAPDATAPGTGQPRHEDDDAEVDAAPRRGTILVIAADPELRDLLGLVLRDAGHVVARAPDGALALDMVDRGAVRPDLILADDRLPEGEDGVRIVARLRAQLGRSVPALILSGSLSPRVRRAIRRAACVPLDKPVNARELIRTIGRLLQPPRAAVGPGAAATPASPAAPVVFVVDDDRHIRAGLRDVLEAHGKQVKDYASGEAFLAAYRPGGDGCLLVDARLPGMSGIEVLHRLREAGHPLPAIVITGNSDVPMAVQAMKAGALDFIEKPVGPEELLASVARAQAETRDQSQLIAWQEAAATRIAGLTPRQRQIMARVLAGQASKTIAAELGISQRTVENHRAGIMKRTGARSLPALARLALAATGASASGRNV